MKTADDKQVNALFQNSHYNHITSHFNSVKRIAILS